MANLTYEHRSKTIKELVGQNLPKAIIKGIIKDPHNVVRSWIFFGPHGTGKCLRGNSLVRSESGLRYIGDYFGEFPEVGFSDCDEKVLKMGKSYDVDKKYYSGIQDTFRFKVDLGFDIEGSCDEPYLVWEENRLSGVWKKATEINVGDLLLVDKGNKELEFKLDRKARILGLLFGDGSFTESVRTIRFMSNDEVLVDEVIEFFREESKEFSFHKVWREHNHYWEVNLKPSPAAREWAINEGFYGRNHSNLSIPKYVYQGNWDVQLSFITGLMDTDGSCAKDGCVEISMNSKNIIDFIQHVLFSFGIISNLQIRGKSNRLFLRSFINLDRLFLLERKKRLCKETVDPKQKRELIVPGLREYLHSKISLRKWSREERELLKGKINHLRKGGLSFERYEEYVEELSKFISIEKRFPHFHIVKVVEKTKGRGKLYDLSVPEGKSFVSNSIIVHNTSLARIFARKLNNLDESYDILNSPFYYELDSASVGNVDSVKELREMFSMSYADGFRVIVFDEAHTMSVAAQSALLKAIEARNDRIFYLFVTTEYDKLLKTIKSRSIDVEFGLVSKAGIRENLGNVLVKEGKEVSNEVLDIIVNRSGGHVRDSLMLLDKFFVIGEEDFVANVNPLMATYEKLFGCMIGKWSINVKETLLDVIRNPLVYIKQDLETFMTQQIFLYSNKQGLFSSLKFDDLISLFSFYSDRKERAFSSSSNVFSFLVLILEMVRRSVGKKKQA